MKDNTVNTLEAIGLGLAAAIFIGSIVVDFTYLAQKPKTTLMYLSLIFTFACATLTIAWAISRRTRALGKIADTVQGLWDSQDIHVDVPADDKRQHARGKQFLAVKDAKTIYLMQHSSSLVLGPKSDVEEHEALHEELWTAIKGGAALRHIINVRGIAQQLANNTHVYKKLTEALNKLAVEDDKVGIRSNGRFHGFVQVKAIAGDAERQARILLIDAPNEKRGVLVFNIGTRRIGFLLEGKLVSGYCDDCDTLYMNYCDEVKAKELLKIPQIADAVRKGAAAVPGGTELGNKLKELENT